jgi:hypothetical protein
MKVDRTQLTEALAELADGIVSSRVTDVVAEAARLLLDFPTDEQVEAFRSNCGRGNTDALVRRGLEAVRQTMIGND